MLGAVPHTPYTLRSPDGGERAYSLLARNLLHANWLKDIRTELYQLLYEKPIDPKNLYLKHKPMKHAQYKKRVTDKQIALMHKRGIWKKPAG